MSRRERARQLPYSTTPSTHPRPPAPLCPPAHLHDQAGLIAAADPSHAAGDTLNPFEPVSVRVAGPVLSAIARAGVGLLLCADVLDDAALHRCGELGLAVCHAVPPVELRFAAAALRGKVVPAATAAAAAATTDSPATVPLTVDGLAPVVLSARTLAIGGEVCTWFSPTEARAAGSRLPAPPPPLHIVVAGASAGIAANYVGCVIDVLRAVVAWLSEPELAMRPTPPAASRNTTNCASSATSSPASSPSSSAASNTMSSVTAQHGCARCRQPPGARLDPTGSVVGAAVTVHSLLSSPAFNGARGVVVEASAARGAATPAARAAVRCKVRLAAGKVLMIRLQNLALDATEEEDRGIAAMANAPSSSAGSPCAPAAAVGIAPLAAGGGAFEVAMVRLLLPPPPSLRLSPPPLSSLILPPSSPRSAIGRPVCAEHPPPRMIISAVSAFGARTRSCPVRGCGGGCPTGQCAFDCILLTRGLRFLSLCGRARA